MEDKKKVIVEEKASPYYDIIDGMYVLKLANVHVELDGIIYKSGSKIPKEMKSLVDSICLIASKPPKKELDFKGEVYFINQKRFAGKVKFDFAKKTEKEEYEHLAYIMSLRAQNEERLKNGEFFGKDFQKAESYSNVLTLSGLDFTE
jgi:hypothetical protein